MRRTTVCCAGNVEKAEGLLPTRQSASAPPLLASAVKTAPRPEELVLQGGNTKRGPLHECPPLGLSCAPRAPQCASSITVLPEFRSFLLCLSPAVPCRGGGRPETPRRETLGKLTQPCAEGQLLTRRAQHDFFHPCSSETRERDGISPYFPAPQRPPHRQSRGSPTMFPEETHERRRRWRRVAQPRALRRGGGPARLARKRGTPLVSPSAWGCRQSRS